MVFLGGNICDQIENIYLIDDNSPFSYVRKNNRMEHYKAFNNIILQIIKNVYFLNRFRFKRQFLVLRKNRI